MNALYRAYFFTVVCLTLWVGYWGFFHPEQILTALPWPVPPLHARFIGAVYLGATTFIGLAIFARSVLEVRTVLRIAFWWTGWLLMVTFLHWSTFDFARTQVWFWVIAYIAFPIEAALLAWGPWSRKTPEPSAAARIRQPWIPLALRVLGAALVVLALISFALPDTIGALWPWKISPFLAQVYSGPLLALGIGCFTLAARRNWPETRIPILGLLVAAALAIVASLRHLALFTAGSPSYYVWFGTLGAITLFTATVSILALRAPRE